MLFSQHLSQLFPRDSDAFFLAESIFSSLEVTY